MKKKWRIILGLVLVAVIAMYSILTSSRGMEAELMRVHTSSIDKTFKEEGKVAPDIERPIHTVYGGLVTSVNVQEGQKVVKGDLLLVFDTRELELQVGQLKAQIKSAQGDASQIKGLELQVDQAGLDLKAAGDNLGRLKDLFEAGAVSKKEYEDAESQARLAENIKRQKEEALAGCIRQYDGNMEYLGARLEQLNYQVDQGRVYAPFAGVVTGLALKEGYVAVPGQAVMTLFQQEGYRVEAHVLTEDTARISNGMKVKLIQKNKAGDITFDGTVERIAPAAVEKMSALGLVEQRIKVTIKPDIPGSLDLRPGYALDVQFTIDRQEGRLVVPRTALFHSGEGDALWVVRDARARVQPVLKGFENDRDVVVEKGLNDGDLVVINPHLKGLKDGKKIIVRKGE